MLVLEYADGSLRDYLKNHYSNLKSEEKLNILSCIIKGLEKIHKLNYIHRDLHSGNILNFNEVQKITDLGLAQSTYNNSNPSSNICGVLPYIAPEILNGKPYTTASDVYSFGILMTEISTGKPPYGSVSHDTDLALAICNGLRPRVAKGTPKCYIDVVNQCLDANLDNRPSASKLNDIINEWQDQNTKFYQEFINADKISSQKSSDATLHPQSIYISRFLNVSNFSKPRNSLGVQVEGPEGICNLNHKYVYIN